MTLQDELVANAKRNQAMQIIAISGCGLIIIGYLALGLHYYHEAKSISQPLPKAQTEED
jgi:hypothetical protein